MESGNVSCKDEKGGEYPDSITGRVDDEAEELSLCNLVTEPADLKSGGRISSIQNEDFGFDFDNLRLYKSMAFCDSPADDLFDRGRLLPLNVICHEKRRLLNEKVQTWRRDSTNFTDFNSPRNQAQQKQYVYSVSDKKSGQGNSRCRSKPPTSVGKNCFKWQQVFSMGLMKTPPMKVEDMYPKQRKKLNNNGLDNTFHKRGALDFNRRSQSVREDLEVRRAREQSGWWMLGALKLKSFKSCRFSSISVMDCLSGVETSSGDKMVSIETDQTDQNSLS